MDEELAAHLERVNAKRLARKTTPPSLAGCEHKTAAVAQGDEGEMVYTCPDCGWRFRKHDTDGRTVLTGE